MVAKNQAKIKQLLGQAITKGEKGTLSKDETSEFHKQFASEYKSSIKEIRSNKNVSYQDLQNIVVR